MDVGRYFSLCFLSPSLFNKLPNGVLLIGLDWIEWNGIGSGYPVIYFTYPGKEERMTGRIYFCSAMLTELLIC